MEILQVNSPTIYTNRLILRKFTLDDLPYYHKIMSCKVTNKYLPWFPTKSEQDALSIFHRNCLNTYDKPCGYRYAICLKEDNVPIGYCGMSDSPSNDIGYGLLVQFWNKGIVTEAVNTLVARIKNAGYPFITATHDVNNVYSGAVMRKLGMQYKYSYRELWQPKNYEVTFRMYQLNFDSVDRTYMEYWDKYPHFIENIECK